MKHNYLKHLFTALLLLCATMASAHDFEVDGFYYNILSEKDKTVEVTYKGNSIYEYKDWYKGNLVIPESVSYNGNTYSVTSVGENAFWCCTELTGVTIPNSITSIGDQAFTYCIKLKYIIIGKNVTSIGFWVFDDCSDYVIINFSQLTFTKGSSDYGEIAERAFKVINNAENIDDFIFSSIDHTLEVYIGDDTELVLPNNYNGKNYSIGANAFSRKVNLTSVEIPGSVTSIGDYAFYGCTALAKVEIPSSVTRIGDYAFKSCTALANVTIGNGVTSIGEFAFNRCTALAKVEIPNSVTRIGLWAFYDCDNLTEVEIPNSVTILESGVFAYCDNLVNVVIPNSVTSIGVLSSGMEGPFEGCISLREVEIPNSVTTIGDCAFNNCTALENIEIPSSVTSIGGAAFNYCTALESVTSLVPADELFEASAFDGLDFDVCTLYVPYGAKAKYASTNDWKNFKKIVELRPTEITITINQYGSATYCSEYALDFSNVDGLKAYAATGYNSKTGVVTLTRLQTAMEGTGLFLIGEPGEYTVPVIEYSNDYTLNLLVGTLEKTTVNGTTDDGNYVNLKYTVKDNTPMFYQFEDGSSLSANKAYLQLPAALYLSNASKSVNLRFDDGETTDIEDVDVEDADVEIVYDLQGRAVENPTKGVYIVNGKKVFINK